jgi:catechol 2,3-dioxygenase-like lactoylglutathione lyase family enzyme
VRLRVEGVTHVALELSSPTRMERYLRDVFGLQLLRQGYLRGEYVRIIGSPVHQRENPGFLILYNRPFIARGRLRHIGVALDQDVESAVAELRRRGYHVDGEDIITGPNGLRLKIDHCTRPRPMPEHDPVTRMAEAAIDPAMPCLARKIHHVAPDVGTPREIQDWLIELFEFDTRRTGDRRGDLFYHVGYSDAPKDPIGRSRTALLALVYRRGLDRAQLNHIAFEMADAEGAIRLIESRGAKVDLPQDAIIHGPEEVWYQIDSHDTPYPLGHPANDPAVTLIPPAHRARA